jgi:hypothetical protein
MNRFYDFVLKLAMITTGMAIIISFLNNNLSVTIGCGFCFLVCNLWAMNHK